MYKFENIQDKIDAYISGTMSKNEIGIFENELQQDDAALRHEVEIQASIANAVQIVSLKDVLQNAEKDYSAVQSKRKGFLLMNIWKRSYSRACIALASVVLLFSIGYSHIMTTGVKGIGEELYAGMTVPTSRNGNDIDKLFLQIHNLIGEKQSEQAESLLHEITGLIENEISIPATNEEMVYKQSILRTMLFDIEWYQVIIHMQQGNKYKAKRLLKEIAEEDGPYTDLVNEILHNKFNNNN